ncbi:hypothetical protein [Methylobacterium ajmalii]|uniref:hypothetical protein n=1 Tax=Methylobacterium ajmalii TaxID=2738439 RepID=UPI002F354D78
MINNFKVGQRVRVLVDTVGDYEDEEGDFQEARYPAGSEADVCLVDRAGVHVEVGPEGKAIIQVFGPGDDEISQLEIIG